MALGANQQKINHETFLGRLEAVVHRYRLNVVSQLAAP